MTSVTEKTNETANVRPEVTNMSYREESVTYWINAIREGDSLAAEHLWQRYFRQLMAQARLRMSGINRGIYDEEDAALSTFTIVCSKLQEGNYSSLANRNELWQLMMTILVRKVMRRNTYSQAAKRNGSLLTGSEVAVENIPASSPLEFSQECFELIAMLNDPNLEQVAMLKFEGYTNEEIAQKLNRTRRTIQRMLNLIRNLWQEALDLELKS